MPQQEKQTKKKTAHSHKYIHKREEEMRTQSSVHTQMINSAEQQQAGGSGPN